MSYNSVASVEKVPSRRGNGVRGHDELGVVCIATPDLGFDDGHGSCIDGSLARATRARLIHFIVVPLSKTAVFLACRRVIKF
jgi:hypothetical protein